MICPARMSQPPAQKEMAGTASCMRRLVETPTEIVGQINAFEVAFLVEDGNGDIEDGDGGVGFHGGAPHRAALKGDVGWDGKARRHHRGVLQGSGGGFDERHVSRVPLRNMKALGGTCDVAVDV